jgi:hypothetical protein
MVESLYDFMTNGGKKKITKADFGRIMHDPDSTQDEIDEALDSIGYTREDLEFMDEDERAEVLEDAGLDPDDWE